MLLPTFNVPPIGPVQGKVWGKTQLVFANGTSEMHVLAIQSGGFSSKHKHLGKWNRFLVLSGELEVHVFRDQMTDVTTLKDGQITDVPPGVWHKFYAKSNVVCIEIYWSSLEAADIERKDTGGLIGKDIP
jgi:mannose-6-phosphate isomerase-like protein (cupin superfamily)